MGVCKQGLRTTMFQQIWAPPVLQTGPFCAKCGAVLGRLIPKPPLGHTRALRWSLAGSADPRREKALLLSRRLLHLWARCLFAQHKANYSYRDDSSPDGLPCASPWGAPRCCGQSSAGMEAGLHSQPHFCHRVQHAETPPFGMHR